MTTEFYFVEPVDTLSMRGNRLFGDSGSFGRSEFPPRPSVLSGAFRSLIWKQCNGDLVSVLNSDFAISGMFLAVNDHDKVEPLWSMPNDIRVTQDKDTNQYKVAYLRPKRLNESIKTSSDPALTKMALLQQEVPSKFTQGLLINSDGIKSYLQDEPISPDTIVTLSSILSSEQRVGIELNASTRSVEDGQLFTVEHTVLAQSEIDGKSKGLLVGVNGRHDSIGQDGLLRLGGDGRVARYTRLADDFSWLFQPKNSAQFKLTLLTPALFENGWLPNKVVEENGAYRLKVNDFSARLVSASISRADVISGWDLVSWKPKDAERAVPQGSVYWFEDAQGDWAHLENYLHDGMGRKIASVHEPRWSEGYNRAIIANWNQ